MTPFLPFGAAGVFREAAIVCFAYGGFDNIATMAEETKNPSRDIPIGLLGSMSIITVIYCLMALSLTMMQKYRDIDLDAAYPIEFQTVLLVGVLGQARYTTHIARAHMIPPWFALVHPKTGTPINATLLIAILAAVLAFFSSLGILSSFLSVSTLFIFMMMAVALLMTRYYTREITPQLHLLKLVIFLLIIIASSIGTSAYWGSKPDGWVGYVIRLPLWFLATSAIQLFLPQQRTPEVWGVPLVPWLPLLSIATNIFLMGSLGQDASIKFGICIYCDAGLLFSPSYRDPPTPNNDNNQ
ncbi:hypothetical protein Pint_11835 [Pistacia integerrima]|uniref:Uncharacterized protein n=1 Tax=Pistacia integerrima TaxID=434235 RepID=A0ACC0XMV8_9ROSI|nr:hypothetical protein Pint_11835 [Pistacia integerrima]